LEYHRWPRTSTPSSRWYLDIRVTCSRMPAMILTGSNSSVLGSYCINLLTTLSTMVFNDETSKMRGRSLSRSEKILVSCSNNVDSGLYQQTSLTRLSEPSFLSIFLLSLTRSAQGSSARLSLFYRTLLATFLNPTHLLLVALLTVSLSNPFPPQQ
jgi:hypothetical protein